MSEDNVLEKEEMSKQFSESSKREGGTKIDSRQDGKDIFLKISKKLTSLKLENCWLQMKQIGYDIDKLTNLETLESEEDQLNSVNSHIY